MKYLLNKKDFEVISTPNNDRILFYTPKTLLFALSDPDLREYIDICRNKAKQESSFLSSKEIFEIHNFLDFEFRKALPSTILKKAPKTEIKSLILPVSGKCNLRCSYCFASENGKFAFRNITTFESKRIIDFLFIHLKLKEIEITFFGGEPFLNFKTIEFVLNYIKENYPDRKIRYSITTNGTVLNERLINLIKQHSISVLISIDGPKEITNHRIDINGMSSFDRTIKTINILKEEGIPIHLRATMSNDFQKFVEVYDFFEKKEIPFKIIFAHDSENKNYTLANYKKCLKLIENQLNSLILYYIKLIDDNRKIYCDSITDKLKFLLYRTKNYHACTGGRTMFSITSTGDIYSCEHLAGFTKYSVGNIQNGINTNRLKILRSINVENIEACKQCWLRYFCAGGCFSNNLTSTSYILRPDENRCELIKLEHKFIIALFYEINKRHPSFFTISETLKEKAMT
jgi:uncharacterized protein